MATTIKLKNGSGAPLAGDLVAGEPALDLTNKRLYTEDSGGTVIEVGTNPTSLTTGTFTSTGIDDNATSTAITIDSSENVGIGVSPTSAWSTSSYKVLDINTSSVAASSTTYAFSLNAYNDGSAWRYKNTGVASQYYQASGNHVWSTVASGTAGNVISFNEAMRIDSSGNVGIGTTSPSSKLHVKGSNSGASAVADGTLIVEQGSTPSIQILSANTQTQSIKFGDPQDGDVGKINYSHNDNNMNFVANGSERMRIDSSGNVGIGATVPSAFNQVTGQSRLVVGGGASNEGMTIYSSASTSGSIAFADGASGSAQWRGVVQYTHLTDSMSFFTANSERMRIDSSGNLLVGTTSTYSTSPKVAIGIQSTGTGLEMHNSGGTAWTAVRFHTAATLAGYISVGTTTTTYNTSSDVRLKENIVDAPAGNIDDIRVRSFDWKADGTHQTYGMVAQELVDVAPEAVTQGATDDDMWGVDYSKLVPMMIKEIQDLRARVAQLEGA